MNKKQILNAIDIIKIERNKLKNNHQHKVYLNAHQLDAIFGLLDLYKELEQNSIPKDKIREKNK